MRASPSRYLGRTAYRPSTDEQRRSQRRALRFGRTEPFQQMQSKSQCEIQPKDTIELARTIN